MFDRYQLKDNEVAWTTKKRGEPEVHIHVAATLVWGADPHAITQADRTQMEKEITQFACVLKNKMIRKQDLEKAFSEFENGIQRKLRSAGCMVVGQ